MVSNRAHILPDAGAAQRAGWPDPADGDMVTDPVSGRVMLYQGGAWAELSAAAAHRLATARTISITGGITGSVTTDFGSDVSLDVTVQDNAHLHSKPFVRVSRTLPFVTTASNRSPIPWESADGYGLTPPFYSTDQIVLGKPGWWQVILNARTNIFDGGVRSVECWGTTQTADRVHGASIGREDAAGRFSGCATCIQYSDGGTLTDMYLWTDGAVEFNEFAGYAIWLRSP